MILGGSNADVIGSNGWGNQLLDCEDLYSLNSSVSEVALHNPKLRVTKDERMDNGKSGLMHDYIDLDHMYAWL